MLRPRSILASPTKPTPTDQHSGYQQCPGRHPRVESPDDSKNRMQVLVQVVDSQSPTTDPQHRAQYIEQRKGPPGHFQDTGGDAAQLSQPVEKAGDDDQAATVAPESSLDLLQMALIDSESLQ